MLLSSMDSEEDATGYSQRTAYSTVFEELRKELAEALKKGSKRLLSTYLQSLLAYPDGCTNGETVFDPTDGRCDSPGAAPLRGEAVPEGEGAGGPGGRRADGGAQGAGLRHPHGYAGISPGGWTTSSPGTGSGWR